MVVINYDKEWSDDICILAIVNIFISMLELIVGILFAYALSVNLWLLQPIIAHGILGLTVIFMICVVIEFYADYQLIMATRETEYPDKAIKKSKFWRSYNVTMISMETFVGLAFLMLGNVQYLFSVLCLLVRMGFIVVVSRYIRQLEINNEKSEDRIMQKWISSLPTEDTLC